jgi:exopolyphosphatase/guanosine-5'-triphosphate,3'-diphosphate pyrophosphatase
MEERIGIIDLGSNTTRLILMAYKPHLCFRLVDEVKETVRLAEGVREDRMLNPGPMRRAVEALKMFYTFCQSAQVEQIVPVATSALREAANREEFLLMLRQETDLDLRVLSGEEEAYYGYLGAINSLPFTDGIVVDIGGGSTEVTAVRGRAFSTTFSQQVGVIRFTERYIKSDPISKKEFRALEEGAVTAFKELDWLKSETGPTMVGMGGTVRNLARMDQKRRKYPLDRLHGYVLKRQGLEEIVDMLRRSSLKERESIPGLSRDRADVIVSGAVILLQLMQQGGFEELLVSGQGLREGLFYDYFLQGQQVPLFDDKRGFSIQNLAKIHNYEAIHAAKVRELSLSLFDQLEPLHGYGRWERELLSYAALLHDIGVEVGYYDHHKHSAYLIFNSALQGFTHREVVLLALLTRYHRKGSVDVNEYRMILADDDEERLSRLSALLRISEYLERSKSQVVQSLKVEIGEDGVRVHVRAVGDATVEVWDANRRTRLFEKAFGQKIEIVI